MTKTRKRILSLAMALAMIFTLLPTTAFADESQIEYDDEDLAKAATGVEADKKVTANPDGTYTITLSVKGTSSTSSTTNDLPADVVLVVDTSGSMAFCGGKIVKRTDNPRFWEDQYVCARCGKTYWGQWTGDGYGNLVNYCPEETHYRLTAAKDAATSFVNGLLTEGSQIQVGLADFSGESHTNVTTDLTQDKSDLLAAIGNLSDQHTDGTSYSNGLKTAETILNKGNNTNKFIVLVSDGEPSSTRPWEDPSGTTEANRLITNGVTIMTVGIDVSGAEMEQALRDISSTKPGTTEKYYYGAGADALSGILTELRETITSTIHAGENAVMTDVINTNSFELVPDQTLEKGLIDNEDGSLDWNIGTIDEDKKTVSFKIKLKDDNTATGEVHTNTDVSLVFDSTKQNKKVKFSKDAIGDPTVTIGPNKPSSGDLDGLANAVKVDCTNTNVTHLADPKTYDLAAGTYSIGAVTKNSTSGKYECVVTVTGTSYVTQYSTDLDETHSLASGETDTKTFTLTWNETNEEWDTPTAPCVTFNVTCNLDAPDGPSNLEVSKLVGAKLTCVATGKDHNPVYCSLVSGTFQIGSVIENKGVYTVTVTVSPSDSYGFCYMLSTGLDHKMVAGQSAQTVTLTWNGTEWTTGTDDAERLYVVFNVTCGDAKPEDPMCTVVYDTNGGTGGPGTVNNLPVGNYTLDTTNKPTRANGTVNGESVPVVFIGWTAAKDTTIYSKGDTAPTTITSIKIATNTTTVYAVWGYDTNNNGIADVLEDTFTLTYAPNGGTGSVEDNNTYLSGNTVTLSSSKYSHDVVDDVAVVQFGWTAEADTKIYSKGDTAPTTITSVTFTNKDEKVYAVYGYDTNNNGTADVVETRYTLTYDANGGTGGPGSESVLAGTHILSTVKPALEGKVFLGWTANESAKGKTYAKAADLPMMVSSVTITDADKTVYAVWSNDETGTTNPGTGDGVADVYQVTIEYKSADTDKGTVTGLTKEVKTIYNPYPTPSTSGTVRTSGSKAEARDGNKFVNWTADFDSLFEESAADLPAKTITVTGGNTYTFIANFAPKSTPIQPPVTAPYKVEHYLWDETTNAYVLQVNDTETIKGTVGEEVTATAKDYENYAVNPYAEGTKSSGFVTAPKVVDGNLTDLLILKLYYDIDEIGGTDKEDTHYPGDNIPDKYQATVKYVSDDEIQGTVSVAKEVITIKDDSGRWAESGKATANGSVAQPGANGVFVKWTQSKNGTAEDTQLSAATGQIKLTNVNGGDIYTFKAFFEAKNSEIDVEKELYQIVDADGKVKYTGPKTDSNPIPMAVVGDTIVWKITVENKGNQELSVAFSDELSLEGRSARLYQIGSIYGGKKDITGPLTFAAGMKDEIWAEYTVQSGDEGKTIYNTITAKVGGETRDRDTAPDSVVVEKKALTVDKTVSATSAKVGDTITYTITVKNSGNVTLTGIKLTDELLDIKDADLGNLKPDESLTKNYSYIVKASDVGTLTNTAVVTADDGITGRDTSDPTTVTKDNDDKETGDPHSLHFVTNGGSHISDISKSQPFDANPYDYIPTRPGYVFEGWYSDLRLQNRLDDKDIHVNGHVTVYAKWTASSVPGMLNGDDHFAYIQGYADGTVRPNNYITRAQVATIFFRLLDADVRDDNLTTYNTFTDVSADYWANTAISTMTKLGVINGYKDGNFRPNAYITRAEFAAICARFDDTVKSGNSSFTDINGHWAKAEIERAATLGWIQGYSDGTFRPNNNITRAQAMTMINRVLCRLPEDEDDLLRGMNTWTDCNPGDWCYLAVQEATNSHDFQHRGVYESWTDLNRDPDWSKYEN